MHYRSVAFTLLELDGLLDPRTEPTAYASAMDKISRVRDGRPRKSTPEPIGGKKPGAGLNMVRPHRAKNCECVECRRSA